MDIFAQNRLLFRFVILLAALNIISMGLLLWKAFSNPPFPPPPVVIRAGERHEVTDILRKELNLTPEQADRMDALRTSYFEKQERVLKSIREERDSMNAEMFNRTTDDNRVLALAKAVSENEYQVEVLRFKQAQELKSICTPDQRAMFERLVREIRDYFRPDNQPQKK
jgi:Spy/CpxP family protein refolding chaperone